MNCVSFAMEENDSEDNGAVWVPQDLIKCRIEEKGIEHGPPYDQHVGGISSPYSFNRCTISSIPLR
jgi:hypothetical protein